MTPRTRAKVMDKKERGMWKTADTMTDEEAAETIQAMFRKRKARKMLRHLLLNIYEKVVDPNTGTEYYYNSKTGESSWEKPSFIGADAVCRGSCREKSTPSHPIH